MKCLKPATLAYTSAGNIKRGTKALKKEMGLNNISIVADYQGRIIDHKTTTRGPTPPPPPPPIQGSCIVGNKKLNI